MKYLIDLTGCRIQDKKLRTFRFTDAKDGYRTAPTDAPANVFYHPRLLEAGEYRTNLFGTGGRVSGAATVDRGDVQLVNNDGVLDEMRDYAFDGYDLIVFAIEDDASPYGTRRPLVTATIDQIELELDKVTLRLRSRLAVLDQPIQEETYKGTTIAGGMDEAEGTADLKGSLKLLSYGAPKNISALQLNAQAQIHGVGHKLGAVSKVRDRGLILPLSGQNFTTIAALRTATVPDGQVATALNLGLIRIGGNQARGQITVDALEGAVAAERTAGQIVRRILIERAGLTENLDFLASDIAALDAAAPYVIGYWIGQTRMTILSVVSAILDSVGGWICPDRLGMFRMGRFTGPAAEADQTFTPMEINREEGATLRRLSIGEDGKGIPPKNMTLQHSRNYTPTNKDALAGRVSADEPDFVDFATTEWRQEALPAPDVEAVHRGAQDLLMQSALQSTADALTELKRRAALHAVERDRFEFTLPTRYAPTVQLGRTYALRFPRFRLDDGRNFVLTALRVNFGKRTSTLEVWG